MYSALILLSLLAAKPVMLVELGTLLHVACKCEVVMKKKGGTGPLHWKFLVYFLSES